MRGWDEKVWCGSQIARPDPENVTDSILATVGCFIRDKNTKRIGLLTNRHFAMEDGTKVYHPYRWGLHLATTKRSIIDVNADEWYNLKTNEPDPYVGVDCAFVQIADTFPLSDIEPELAGVGKLGELKEVNFDDMSIIGQKVLKVGRATGLTKGTIIAFSYEYRDAPGETEYTDFSIVGENGYPFEGPGDSGSIIVSDDNNHNPLGLLWGGEIRKIRTGHKQEYWTGANSLSRILSLLDVEIVK